MNMTQELDRIALLAAQRLRRSGDTHEEFSTSIAVAVGCHARRSLISQTQLKNWASSAYGYIWVKENNLNPGMDLKDVVKVLLKAYNSKHLSKFPVKD